jgi:hypothetical protein
MSMYPFNPNGVGAQQQSDSGRLIDRCHPAHYRIASVQAADTNYLVESTNMQVGAYTLAHTTPSDGAAHNVTVTQTAADTEDTNGTIVVVGTDLAGNAITETLIPNAGATVEGAKAFRTVTSVTGAGWVIDGVEGTNDTIVVGFGDILGLPDRLPHNTVMMACLNDVREAVAPTVVTSATALEDNTVDLNSALVDAQPVDIYYVV